MKAVVAAFNQEKALVGAFSVITNLRMELFEALQVIVIRRNYNVDPRQHVPRPAGLVMDEDELDKYTAPAPPSNSKKVSRST